MLRTTITKRAVCAQPLLFNFFGRTPLAIDYCCDIKVWTISQHVSQQIIGSGRGRPQPLYTQKTDSYLCKVKGTRFITNLAHNTTNRQHNKEDRIMTKRVHVINDVKVNITNSKMNGDGEYVILVQGTDVIAMSLSQAKKIAAIILEV